MCIRDRIVSGEEVDPSRDTLVRAGGYGVIYNPRDGTLWASQTGPFPGRIVRLDFGDNPPETCMAEVYEPPSIENPDVDAAKTGHAPRGIDVDRNGVIWTALSGSGHMASFDRAKCTGALNGPDATGQHCPEGWTLYPTPGPQMKGVSDPGSADFHYYNWVDQYNTLGLGENFLRQRVAACRILFGHVADVEHRLCSEQLRLREDARFLLVVRFDEARGLSYNIFSSIRQRLEGG